MVSVFVTAGSDLGTGIEFIFYAVFYPEFRLINKEDLLTIANQIARQILAKGIAITDKYLLQ